MHNTLNFASVLTLWGTLLTDFFWRVQSLWGQIEEKFGTTEWGKSLVKLLPNGPHFIMPLREALVSERTSVHFVLRKRNQM